MYLFMRASNGVVVVFSVLNIFTCMSCTFHVDVFQITSLVVGKWHLGHVPPHDPLSHGFDEWLGLPFSSDMGCECVLIASLLMHTIACYCACLFFHSS